MNKYTDIDEISGEIVTHRTFECAHCDEPSERRNAATPVCPNCGREICPCCTPDDCPEPTTA